MTKVVKQETKRIATRRGIIMAMGTTEAPRGWPQSTFTIQNVWYS